MEECVDNLNREDEKEKLVSSLWGAERCLRVLESVSVTRGFGETQSTSVTGSAWALEVCKTK